MVKILITMIAAVVISLPSAAQQERKFIRGGNDLFNKQDFEKAEVEYRKALDTEVKSYEGAFNLGDALYKQKKFDEALQQFQSLAQNEKDKEKLGELYHNIGNTLLAMNKLDESIEAYKQSLRNRPNSQETKYNLEFARKQKQDQQIKIKIKIKIRTRIRTRIRTSRIKIKINRIKIRIRTRIKIKTRTSKIRIRINKIKINRIKIRKINKIKTSKTRISRIRINNSRTNRPSLKSLKRMPNAC